MDVELTPDWQLLSTVQIWRIRFNYSSLNGTVGKINSLHSRTQSVWRIGPLIDVGLSTRLESAQAVVEPGSSLPHIKTDNRGNGCYVE